MHFTTRMFVPAAAFAFAIGVTPLMAQQAPAPPAPRQEQPAPAPDRGQQQTPAMSVEGELLRVDAETKLLWVRGADSKEQQFRFTDTTTITGEGRSVEGLATMTGTRVKVEYKTEAGANVATKIDIQARNADQPEAPRSPQQ
jgi:hypothetical protein